MKIINKPSKINSPLSQSNIIRDWFYLATEKYENNTAYIKKDNLGRNHNILFYKVKRHVSFLAYSHIAENLLNEKVVIIGRNSYEWIISYLSLLITGTTAVPLDSGLKEEEIENSISRITPALIICDSTKFELIKNIKEKLNLNFKIYLTEKDDKLDIDEDILTVHDVIANIKETNTFKKVIDSITNIEISADDTKVLLFTSGTTSQSKIVELSNKNIISNLKAIQAVIPITSKDITLALLPFHHTFGILGVLVLLFSGGTIAFVESMKKFKDNIKEYSPTLLFLVPAVLELVYKKIYSGIKKSGKEDLINKIIKFSNKLLEFNIDIRRLLFKKIINELRTER